MNNLTVIVPVYNRATLVGRTLDSIAASGEQPQELVIVDNGSTDGTLACCRDWAERHTTSSFHVTVLEAHRRGASVARNVGLAACKTDYVYFFDSDDLFSADFVADILSVFQSDSLLDVLFVPTCQEVSGHVSVRSYQPTAHPWVHILNSQLNTLSMVFRTFFLREVGGWDEQLTVWDDWELGLRVLLASPRWRWLTGKAYHHVLVHDESQTDTGFAKTADATLKAMNAALCDVEKNALEKGEMKKCQRAMYYRCRIMEGHLLREQSPRQADMYALLGQKLVGTMSWRNQRAGDMLAWYVRHGYRGAWRLALMLV